MSECQWSSELLVQTIRHAIFFVKEEKKLKNPLTNARGCGIILFVRYVGREMNICDAGVAQWQSSWFVISRLMVRLRSPAPYGSVPEWPKGTDCKSAAFSFGGPNPPAPTSGESPRTDTRIFWCACPFFAARVRVSYVDLLCAKMKRESDFLLFCHHQVLAQVQFCRSSPQSAICGHISAALVLFRANYHFALFFQKPLDNPTDLCYNIWVIATSDTMEA